MMNIIIVSSRKTLSLGSHALLALFATWLALPLLVFWALSAWISPAAKHPDHVAEGAHLQDDLNTMAARLGKLQAQVLRLDALGGRLAKHFGLPEKEFNFQEIPGQGGAEIIIPQRQLDAQQLKHSLEIFEQHLEQRTDKLGMLEALTLRERVEKSAFPSLPPVTTGWFSSNFGWRLDPFSGRQSMHEGVDFMASHGTPVQAAAGGKVVSAEYHPQYGNIVTVDHGNGLVTRYAHASRVLVKAGDIVLQGQKIAEVGNTGRSTGAHLHFEVLSNGTPQNPARYLHASGERQG